MQAAAMVNDHLEGCELRGAAGDPARELAMS
jgi:hypothetical protein